MPSEEHSQFIPIRYTSEFKRNLRQLAKKYRRIKSDIQLLLDSLTRGEILGDQVPGVQYKVFKVRANNSDSGKGKSGGYRVIYQRTEAGIILITIYSKSEQEDIALHEIRRIILEEEKEQAEAPDPSPSDAVPSDAVPSDTPMSDSSPEDEA